MRERRKEKKTLCRIYACELNKNNWKLQEIELVLDVKTADNFRFGIREKAYVRSSLTYGRSIKRKSSYGH